MAGNNILTSVLDLVSQSLQIPVIIFLLLFAITAIVLLGSLIKEYFNRKKVSANEMKHVIKELSHAGNASEMSTIISDADIPQSQKRDLIELIESNDLDDDSRLALAKKLVDSREKAFTKRLGWSDVITRLGPTLGLMGTLIPMGPGLAALGSGDIVTLSNAIIVAFDTTVVGIGAGALAYVISKIRRRWYSEYIANLDVLTDVVLTRLKKI